MADYSKLMQEEVQSMCDRLLETSQVESEVVCIELRKALELARDYPRTIEEVETENAALRKELEG